MTPIARRLARTRRMRRDRFEWKCAHDGIRFFFLLSHLSHHLAPARARHRRRGSWIIVSQTVNRTCNTRLYDNIIIYIFSKRSAAKDVICARRMHGQLPPVYKYSNTHVPSRRRKRSKKVPSRDVRTQNICLNPVPCDYRPPARTWPAGCDGPRNIERIRRDSTLTVKIVIYMDVKWRRIGVAARAQSCRGCCGTGVVSPADLAIPLRFWLNRFVPQTCRPCPLNSDPKTRNPTTLYNSLRDRKHRPILKC